MRIKYPLALGFGSGLTLGLFLLAAIMEIEIAEALILLGICSILIGFSVERKG
jgi:hypothetical protein